MSTHEHDWQVQPRESSTYFKRYRCECGAWGWRNFPRRRNAAIPPVKSYARGYRPEPELTVHSRHEFDWE